MINGAPCYGETVKIKIFKMVETKRFDIFFKIKFGVFTGDAFIGFFEYELKILLIFFVC